MDAYSHVAKLCLQSAKFYFPRNQNFDESTKFIAHEIFALYGIMTGAETLWKPNRLVDWWELVVSSL